MLSKTLRSGTITLAVLLVAAAADPPINLRGQPPLTTFALRRSRMTGCPWM